MANQVYRVIKGGRLRNAAARDQGRVVHLMDSKGREWGKWDVALAYGKAICGAEPGRKSAGWVAPPPGGGKTCQRCFNKVSKRV